MGKGGARVGSGRPRKDEQARWLGGVRAPKEAPQKAAAAPPVERFGPPVGLGRDQRLVWERLAPHAFEARTLTRGTAAAFQDLCEAVVLRDKMVAQIEKDGLTYLKVTVDGAGQEHRETKAHPLLTQHRGMYQRVENGMLKFRLAPMGKPIEAAPEQPADPFAEFDAKPAVN